MQLYEEGLFRLDDPVVEYLPSLGQPKVFAGGDADSFDVRESAREMTVRDLLMHTSGLAASNGRPRWPTSAERLVGRARASASASGCCWTRRLPRPSERPASTSGAAPPRPRSSSRRPTSSSSSS